MAAYNSPTYEQWVPGIEVDHVGAALAHLRSVFPEASLNPSSVEATLLEAMAVIVGPIAYAYQRVPSSVMEHFMGLHGLFRHQGRPAVGKAVFRVSGSAAEVEIPAGTVLRHYVSANAGTLEFTTTETLVILPSESVVGEAWIEATEPGTSHNGLTVGARLDVVGYMLAVEAVQISETTRAGEDEESDASFEERATALLARQTVALVDPDQFGSAALTREEVGRVTVVNNWSPYTGEDLGNVSVAVTDTTGLPLPDLEKDEIRAWLENQALASLVIHVIDPTYTTVGTTAAPFEVTVEAAPATNHAQIEDAVLSELARRLDPLTWNWWPNVTAYDITSWIDDVPGVARVVAVPPAGITLTGVAPLPRLGEEPGAVRVIVNEPSR